MNINYLLEFPCNIAIFLFAVVQGLHEKLNITKQWQFSHHGTRTNCLLREEAQTETSVLSVRRRDAFKENRSIQD